MDNVTLITVIGQPLLLEADEQGLSLLPFFR